MAILGDDFTGCCDSAAPFAALGAKTRVVPWRATQPDEIDALSSAIPSIPLADERATAQVVSICTASRHDSENLAAEKIAAVMRRCALPKGRIVKKIDSTLKGNIASEVAAALEHLSARVALIAPAFPEQRRTISAAHLQAPGLARPVHLPTAVQRTGGPPVRHFSQDQLAEISRTRQAACDALPAHREFWTFDGTCTPDLERTILLAEQLGSKALLVGSAGLTYVLARRWRNPDWNQTPRPLSVGKPSGPFLAIAGSRNPQTSRQLDRLQSARGGVDVVDACQAGETPLTASRPARQARPLFLRWDWSQPRQSAFQAYFRQVAGIAGTLVLTGGDTAQWFADLTHVDAIDILGDVEPGISWGVLRGGQFDGWRMIAKAGGFGDDDALVRLYDQSALVVSGSPAPHD